ncbi:hypothetical protein J2P12_05470 [Candidatus Bathyarchaeota archaeon]|nr:hypothetical protein [Candidatus Bathyarchaeota archaeon]
MRFVIAAIIAVLVLAFLPAVTLRLSASSSLIHVSARTLVFASSTDIETYTSDPVLGNATFLGNAQFVCLNLQYPTRCPTGATFYGWPSSGWRADLSTIPTANWIWAPNITGQTTPAEYNQFYFSRTIHLSGSPVSGSISIAVDDFAEVFLNGHVVGEIGSINYAPAAVLAQSYLQTFDLTPFLVAGNNVLTIFAENGAFGQCCPSSYSGNPAGVVFGGTIVSQTISA